MAEETRAQLYAKILANLPDNTTEQITPATDRAVEDAEVESCYNLQDDDATKVNYSPTSINADWLPEGDPAEVGEGLDILAARTGVNLPQSIAYVSNNGNNTGITPELGNPLKPFLTIKNGLDAVGSYGRVLVAPGTYTENLSGNNRVAVSLIMNGVILNGNVSIIAGANGFKYVEMYGSTINGTFRLDNGFLKGGKINGQCLFFSSDVSDLIINNTSGFGMSGGNTNKFFNCEITGSTIAIRRCFNSEYNNCTIIGANCWEDLNSTSTVFNNCDLISTGKTLIGSNREVNAILNNCNIKSSTAENIDFSANTLELKAKNCSFSSPTSNLLISTITLNRTVNEQTTFESCSFVAGATGAILVEPASYSADAGTTLFINCTINKSSITNVTPLRVTEHNTYSFLNLQDFA